MAQLSFNIDWSKQNQRGMDWKKILSDIGLGTLLGIGGYGLFQGGKYIGESWKESLKNLQPPDFSQIGSEDYSLYRNIVRGIAQGQLPEGYRQLTERLKRDMMAEASSTAKRMVSRLAAQGVMTGGLAGAISRDVQDVASNRLARVLSEMQNQLYLKALDALAQLPESERKWALEYWKAKMEARKQASEEVGTAVGGVTNLLGNVVSFIPKLIGLF